MCQYHINGFSSVNFMIGFVFSFSVYVWFLILYSIGLFYIFWRYFISVASSLLFCFFLSKTVNRSYYWTVTLLYTSVLISCGIYLVPRKFVFMLLNNLPADDIRYLLIISWSIMIYICHLAQRSTRCSVSRFVCLFPLFICMLYFFKTLPYICRLLCSISWSLTFITISSAQHISKISIFSILQYPI